MSNKKQTVVEWLASNLGEHIIWEEKLIDLVEQAKAMHKQEIIDAANKLLYHGTGPGDTAAEQYYNETFGGEDESNH
jgi:hypothetical protein